ncbi:MAG: alpha/beta hydrolase [Acidimicrobiia bacterium]|nr:alpha/beta hydrolase [Acidimicrobiia bacterium]
MRRQTTWRFIWAAVFALVIYGVWFQFASPYEVMPEARAALATDERVVVTTEPFLTFTPTDRTPTVGMILYSEARVPPEAYAPLARRIAEAGYLVVVPPMAFNFALLSSAKADEVIKANPDIQAWALGGHGHGGTMAARFTEGSSRIDAIVQLAAHPGDSTRLDSRGVLALSVYGSQDGLVSVLDVEAASNRLPDAAEYVLIPGANHSQFGSYGVQSGDNAASIPPAEQQDETAAAIIRLLRDL